MTHASDLDDVLPKHLHPTGFSWQGGTRYTCDVCGEHDILEDELPDHAYSPAENPCPMCEDGVLSQVSGGLTPFQTCSQCGYARLVR